MNLLAGVSKVTSVSQRMAQPFVQVSKLRLTGFLELCHRWRTSSHRLLTMPVLVWQVAKDPLIVLHAAVVGAAPAIGLVFLGARLMREILGALFFAVFIFVPFEILALFRKTMRSASRMSPGSGLALVTTSTIEIDIRIDKYRRSFLEAGFDVFILGISEDSQRHELSAPRFRQVKVPIERHKFHDYWRAEQFFELIQSGCGIYHANDLTSLPVCYYAALVTGAKLVFDAHEIWSENVTFDTAKNTYVGHSPLRKKILTAIERFYSRHADLFVTVNDEIAKRYESLYHLDRRPLVIKNVPAFDIFNKRTPVATGARRLRPDNFLVGYIGGLGRARNIEGVIRALPYTSENVHFQIMGPASEKFEPEYRALAKSLGVENRVHVSPGVPMAEVFEHMKELDAGIAMLENICLNFYLFLPNKIFEYMASGTPILISDFPVVRPIVLGEKIGFTFDPSDPKSIANAINELEQMPLIERRQMGERALQLARETFYWEKEITRLVDIYRGFISSASH